MSVSVSESGETVQNYRPSRRPSLARQKHVASLRMLQMKMRTRLLILFVGLASLCFGTVPAKAAWAYHMSFTPGYPIAQANGGSGDAFIQTGSDFPYLASVNSDETCTASGPSGTSASPNYDSRADVVCSWDTTAPPPPLTLTFSAKASASFSNNNSSSHGYASAGASTNAASVQAGVSVSSGSQTDSPPSQTVTITGPFPYKFYVDANSSASGYIYGGNSTGGNSSFTSGSSSSINFAH